MRTLLIAWGGCLGFVLAEPALAAPPNVLVILTDDQGWGDLSIHGNTNLRTPHVDSLARDGARFERFFVQPVCSPTRAEFLTGRYHVRGGVRGVTSGGERLNLDEQTIAELFRAGGYRTGCFGKWHNGSQYPYHPRGRGFDEYFGFTSGHWADYFDAPLDHNGTSVRGNGFLTDDLTDRAMKFMTAAARDGKPSFTYLAYNTPHAPMQVPDAFWNRFQNAELKLTGGNRENLNHTRAALALCENIDQNVGRLLEHIKTQKAADSTIVVYFCDNGPNGARWNGGMKGTKGSTDEGGVRSPLHIRWPGRIAPGTVVQPIAAAIDLLPTLGGLAGIPAATRKPLDGQDLSPWLLGTGGEAKDRVLFQTWAGKLSARTQQYRRDTAGKLFDMIADPAQTMDVTARQPDVSRRMAEAMAAFPRLPKEDNRRFPVGYPEFPRAVLPARDGQPHGGIQRSSVHPNCTYFTRWIGPDDRMTWPIEVARAGRYEAIVQYTCPARDIGSMLELRWNDRVWQGQLTVPFESALRGPERDRVPRTESTMKDFQPLSLGIIELPAGTGELTLRATTIAGQQVADMRAVELVLK